MNTQHNSNFEALYHYTGSGLDYIYLASGYEVKKTPFGQGVTIQNLEGLHAAIMHNLMCNYPNWTGVELRFIRKEMGLTQKSLGLFVSRDAQTIALWEKGEKSVPDEATNILRGIHMSRKNGSVKFEELLMRINDLDRQTSKAKKQAYAVDSEGWHSTKNIAA
ncbi:hypothetical protein MNBD_GAMMA07-1936 [hydrothermal vent metagenome]|uniref:HTH cro/C1-type domain-containing protein n=1 Tax=hydrothermal vent metagenome TaxID=652676 RepID=A0A3B0WAF1_9ZZZZ